MSGVETHPGQRPPERPVPGTRVPPRLDAAVAEGIRAAFAQVQADTDHDDLLTKPTSADAGHPELWNTGSDDDIPLEAGNY